MYFTSGRDILKYSMLTSDLLDLYSVTRSPDNPYTVHLRRCKHTHCRDYRVKGFVCKYGVQL